MDRYLKPITALLPLELWPPELLALPAQQRLFFTEFRIVPLVDGLACSCTLTTLGEIAVACPGAPDLQLVVAPGQMAGTASFQCLLSTAGDRLDLTLEDLAIAVRFPPEILAPVAPAPGEPVPSAAQLELRGSLHLDETFDITVIGFDKITLPPAMIGRTGLIIDAEDVLLDLSRSSSPPEILDAGFGEEFVGVFMRRATLRLPDGFSVFVPEAITFTDAAMGNLGFSGACAVEWNPELNESWTEYTGPGGGRLFGIPIGLRRLAVEIRQNSIVSSDVRAEVLLPFFDQPVALDLAFGTDGSLSASLSAVQPAGVTTSAAGVIEFEKPGLLRLRVDSIGFEAGAGDFLVRLSGAITLLYGGLDWPEVEVRELSIDRAGHVRIDGGWLDLPRAASLDFNGFAMELQRIGFGRSGDRQWIGFSGDIQLIDQLAFGASVDGLKVLWDAAGHVDLQMSAVSVELTVPDVLSFNGRVEYVEEPAAKGFKGDVSLTLDALGATFDASLIVGRHTETPIFNFAYVYVNAQLPAGIPIGQTNLAIYGCAGVLGTNVAPDKPEALEWFAWYAAPPVGATAASKWRHDYGSQALGVGITIGTATDNGYAFSAKAILVVLFPGPLMLLDGKANLLEDRSKLDGAAQGQHRALAVIDRRAGTFLLNLQPTFKYDPASGAMIQITGPAEAYFEYDRPEAWHVYIGEAEPVEKRIRARILKGLLNADAYLMLDRAGMRLGAGAGLDREYDFGRLSVAVAARIDGQAEVSWRPIQMDGLFRYDAIAELRAFGCSASVSIDTQLEVQTPDPYHVHASFRVRLRTPWPLPDPSARVTMEWGDPDGEPLFEPVVGAMSAEHLKVMDVWNLRVAPDTVEAAVPTVPLDARVLVSFNRPVADEALVGCNAGPPPRPERIGGLEVLHELQSIALERRSPTGWDVVERRAGGEGNIFGAWLPLPDKDSAAATLQLWSATPFTYARRAGRGYLDRFLEDNPRYPCVPPEPAEPACVHFDRVDRPLQPSLFVVGDLIFEFPFVDKAMQPRILVRNGARVLVLTFQPNQPLVRLRITPHEPAAMVQVRVAGAPPGVTLNAYGEADALLDTRHTTAAGETVLVAKGIGIEYVELESNGAAEPHEVEVREVCVTARADHERAIAVERARHHLSTQMASASPPWCGKGHLLEPDSFYRLTVETVVKRWRDGSELDALPATMAVTHFRTAGPPGALPTGGPLRDLSPYVDGARSTPAAGAPAFYGAYDVRVAFNENYVERMYDGIGRPLSAALLDRNGTVARDSAGTPVEIVPVWDTEPHAEPTRADRLWLWTLQRASLSGCGPLAEGDCMARPDALVVQLPSRPLAPRQLVELSLSASGAGAPLHRSGFTTSRFATFAHHVLSFRDTAWDYAALSGLADEPLLTPAAAAALADLVRARRDEHYGFDAEWEAATFEDLETTVFTLGHRPLPERLEVTVLRDGQRSYGLLLESPEPIEWRRVTLDVRHAPAPGLPRRGAPRSLRIAGALLPPAGTDAAAEWVELMALAETDVSGVTIRHAPLSSEAPSRIYYTFGSEQPLAPGTIVRIHPAPGAVAVAPERVVRHAHVGEGEAASRLESTGALVSLVSQSGEELHRAEVRPEGAFQPLAHVLIRSEDQTRAFLFVTSPIPADAVIASLPDGVWRLDWNFARDIGVGAPLLTRRGSAAPEDASIEFRVPA